MWLRFSVHLFQFLLFSQSFENGRSLSGNASRNAHEGTYPFAVSIQHLDKGSAPGTEPYHRCTGTLVSRVDVITAAHCIDSVYLHEIKIFAGSADVRYGTPFFPYWWLTYNEWASNMEVQLQYKINDIGWIKLETEIPQGINAIIGNYTNEDMYGKKPYAWGWSYFPNGTMRYALQKAGIRIMTKSDCDAALSQVTGAPTYSDKRILCSFGDPPVVFEPGDNGGPLIFRHRLSALNIASCAGFIDNRKINVHTGLWFYNNFLNYMLNNL